MFPNKLFIMMAHKMFCHQKFMWFLKSLFKIHPADVFREATTEFTVDARPLTKAGGDHIRTQITCPSGSPTDCLVQDNADGTYSVEYTPFEKGNLWVFWFGGVF